jgi:hypothetical protein
MKLEQADRPPTQRRRPLQFAFVTAAISLAEIRRPRGFFARFEREGTALPDMDVAGVAYDRDAEEVGCGPGELLAVVALESRAATEPDAAVPGM